MKRRHLLSLALLSSTLPLVGCALQKSVYLFERSGRFSLMTPNEEGKMTAINGRFSLRRTPEVITLDLMTPLNGILARIEITPSEATLTRDLNTPPLFAPSGEELMQQVLGFALPIPVLEDWLSTKDNQVNAYGWKVHILKRTVQGMPSTIRAQCSVPSVKLTLSIDNE